MIHFAGDKKEVGNVQPTDTVPANELTGPDTNGQNNIGGFDGFDNEGQYNGNENIGGVNGNGNGGDFNGNRNIGGFNGNGNGGTGNGNGNIDFFIDSWRQTTDNQSKGAVESKDGKDNVGGHTENGSGVGASGSGNDNSEKIDGDKALEAANVGRLVQTTTPISYFRRTRRLYSLLSRWF